MRWPAHGQFGIDLPNQFLECQPERIRSKAGARDNEKGAVGAKGVRIVDRALGCLVGQSCLFHRTDDTDDGE